MEANLWPVNAVSSSC